MIKYAIIPAAGRGTRLYPLTKYFFKELLPINDTPIIEYSIIECIEANVSIIYIVTNKEKIDSMRYLKIKFKNKIKIHFIIQNFPKGLGDAVYLIKNLVGENPFFVILPDELIFSNEKNSNILIQLYNRYYSTNTVVVAVQKISINNYNKFYI